LPDATKLHSVIAKSGSAVEIEESSLGVLARVPVEAAFDVLSALKSEGYGFLVDLFAHDTGEGLEITYHVRDFGRMDDVFVRAAFPYDATIRSIWELYPAANFPEREAAELFGFSLEKHPYPARLLTTDGCEPYLRKSVEVRTAEEVRRRGD